MDEVDLFDLIDSADDSGSAADPETADAPETDVAPDADEATAETDEPEADGDEPAADGEADESAPLAEATSPEPEPEIDWEHPALAAVYARSERLAQLEQAAYQQQAINQQQYAIQQQQEIANQLVEFTDGDMDRFGQLTGTIAQITQPLQYQAQAHEQRATGAEKALSAFFLAVEATVPPEHRERAMAQFQELMTVEGPEVMQKLAFAEHTNAQKYAPQLAAKDQKIAELERRLQASARTTQRRANGADRVDSQNGLAPVGAKATSEDDFFKELWG